MPDLYATALSAPCRAVLLVSRALGVQLNVKPVDMAKGEHMAPEYVKRNLQHTVPTLDDRGFILWESRAITAYLVDQYGKTDALNPTDPKTRALVNQRLYFDSGTLYSRLTDYYIPVVIFGRKPDKEKAAKFEEALGYLNFFLEGKTWVAGNQKTIADYSLVVTVSTAEAFGIPVNTAKYANVSAWFERAKREMPGYEELNGVPVRQFGELFRSKAASAAL